jgi:hypothetical protein
LLARAGSRLHRGVIAKEAEVAQKATRPRILDDGGWKPFAISATVTLLVAGIHTGFIDAVMGAATLHMGG